MALNKKVVESIVRFVENPSDDLLIKMVKTGSIFRFLSHSEQLGEEICGKLSELLSEGLKKVSDTDLVNLYSALGRGLVSSGNMAVIAERSFLKNIIKPRPSLNTSVY